MKRLLIFVLLGPPLGFLVTLAETSLMTGQIVLDPRVLGFGLPLAYFIGIIPAWLALMADWLFERFSFWPHVAATCLAGYVIGAATGMVLWSHAIYSLRDVVMFGLMGAIPAAVCSLFSGRTA